MTKRTFLKLAGAILGSAPGGRLLGKAPDEATPSGPLTNWAGNIRYSTGNLHQAETVEQVREFIRSRDSLRVLGSRHCFNRIADSSQALLSLRPMDGISEIDPKARTVTVGPGVTYGQLCPILHEKGFALHNLASLPHISVAGACATATHGSGVKLGNLATAVSGLEVVTADGSVLNLSAKIDGDAFLGAVVHLGALGAVTKVTLDVEPTFAMRQHVYVDMPMAKMADHFEEIMASGDSVSLFTDWRDRRINEVWIKSRVGEGGSPAAAPEFHGATLATRDLHPIAELSAVNCTAQMGVPGPWYDRMPHFRMGFTPSRGDELQAEYFVPLKDAVEAISAIERLHDRISPHLFISELRTIAADRLWMSPAYQRPSLSIHFTWKPEWDAVRELLPVIEKELAPFDPRPHWGKLFTMAPAQLQSRYERLDDFKALLQEHDPRGKFRNEFLATNLYG